MLSMDEKGVLPALMREVGQAIVAHDRKGRIIDFTKAFSQLSGYGPEQMREMTLGDIAVNPEAVLKFLSKLSGEPLEFEAEVSLKDGSKADWRFRSQEVECGGESVVISRVDDVSEQRWKEKHLDSCRSERDLLKNLLETANVIILLLDSEGRVRLFNKKAEELTGFSLEEAKGESWIESFVPERARKEVRKVWQETVSGEETAFTHTNPILTKKGEERVVRWRNTLVPLEDGKGVLAVGEDVTEKEGLLEEREKEKRRLSQIVNGYAAPTFVIGRDHEITHWNSAMEELTGVPAEEKLGTKAPWSPFYEKKRPVMADLVIENDKERLEKHYGDKGLRKAPFREGAYEAEDFFPAMGKWLHFTAAPLKDESGEIIGAIETVLDVTSLKKEEERLKNFIEGLADPVFEMDTEGRFVRVNKAFEKLTGRERKEVLGERFDELGLLPEGELPRVWDEVKKFMKGEPTEPVFQFHVERDGERVPVEVKASLVKERDEARGVRVVARDVSARERAEEAKRMFKAVFEATKDSIFIMSYPDLEIVDVNPAAEELTGYAEEEMLGKGPFDFGPESMPREELRKRVLGEAASGIFETQRVPLVRKDGSAVVVEQVNSRFELEDETYLVSVMRDVTELEEKEKELKRRVEELEEFHDVAVGREKRIEELKRELEETRSRLKQ